MVSWKALLTNSPNASNFGSGRNIDVGRVHDHQRKYIYFIIIKEQKEREKKHNSQKILEKERG